MSIHRASQLTMWGFGVMYTGIMGVLVVLDAPAMAPYWKLAVSAFSALALAGLVVMLAGRLVRLDDQDSEQGPM